MRAARIKLLLLCLAAATNFVASTPHAREGAAKPKPAPEIAPRSIAVGDGALLPLYVSRDWSQPQADIERAVIVQHGHARNANVYFRTGLAAQAAAGEAGQHALIVAPQFIAPLDVETFRVPDDVLRYTPTGWEGGDAALGPRPISSFEAIDAILAKLADRHLFPKLKDVVLAGHSGGGQVVQRYAIVGKGAAALRAAGIAMRYVVANPSSYAYFGPDRPEPAIAAACPRYDDWKYGMQRLPAYAAPKSPADHERDYVAARVIYLLGALDTNPEHPVLDRSCMAEAQGPTRWARGHAYVDHMRARNQGMPRHEMHEVPGVGHDGDAMLGSACGLTALFDVPGCR